jgi:DNA-binding CsgD family transcriptional regulator
MAAAVAAETGDPPRAARLIGATDALLDAIDFTLAPFVAVLYDRARARAARDLGATMATQQEAGRHLSRAEALAEAYAVVSGVASETAPPSVAASAGLSPRELEVLRLVAAGRSNREIADVLFISVPTVKRHLTNILGKLQLPSRSALTAYAHRHELV